MGLSIKGLSTVLANMRRTEDKVVDGSLQALRDGAEVLMTLARKNAPIDEGDLESAIVMKETRARTILGRFGQTNIEVGVDPSRLDLERRKGFDYSIPMHESTYNLGPLSAEKQAGQAEVVGPKYLERAMRELEDAIRTKVEEAVKRAIR